MKKIFLFVIVVFLFVSCVSLEERITEAQETLVSAYSEGDTKDTWNLRDGADFEVEVYNGVWWVPASSLGNSRYTNKQIASIVNFNPAVKKAIIGNLYEAIQLYQICDFCSDTNEDTLNVRVKDTSNGYRWEKHCPGYYAVALNRGNCSTCTNWLIYLLEDDFEEWGTFHFQDADGSGHVINYFVYDGYYYFIDMTHYRNDFEKRVRSAVEDGKISTYRNTGFISGNIHKAVSPEAYVEYCLNCSNEPPTFFFMIKKHEVPDVTSDRSRIPTHMVLDASIKKDFTAIYIDPERMSYGFYNNGTESVNWAERSRHTFGKKTKF